MFVFRLRDGAAPGRVIALASFALALSCALARAGQDAPANPPPNDGVIKEVLKKVGLAADPGPPADFVRQIAPGNPRRLRSGRAQTLRASHQSQNRRRIEGD